MTEQARSSELEVGLVEQSALLLVDVQEAFLRRPQLVPARGLLEHRFALLLDRFREHRRPIIHVRTVVDDASQALMAHFRKLQPCPCVRGSDDCRVPALLRELPAETVVEKRGYSAFEQTDLAARLKSLGTRKVVVAGLYGHACVRQTALDATSLGLIVHVVWSAVGSPEPVHAEAARRWLEARGVESAGRPVESLLARVVSAQRNWALREHAERVDAVARFADQLEAERSSLAEGIALEVGKPIRFARQEVDRAIEHVRISAAAFASNEQQLGPGVTVHFEPRGVVATLSPWNNPVALTVSKWAPALVFGNAVLHRASPRAPTTTARVLECWRRVARLEGLVTLLPPDDEITREVVTDPRVRAVSLTGAESTGRLVASWCAPDSKPLQAELGGNNGVLLGTGFDAGRASSWLLSAAFGFAGQRCTAARRVVVVGQAGRGFVERFVERARRLELGPVNDEGTVVGPLVDAAARDRVAAVIARAESAGATVLLDGRTVRAMEGADAAADRWLGPTIVQAEDTSLEIVQEETFGPLLVVQVAENFEQGLELLAGVRQGLAATLYSSSDAEKRAFRERAGAALLRINPRDERLHPEAPFGGRKASALGPAEHGVFDRELFAQPRALYDGDEAEHP